jgi:hypothetical protein
METPGGDPLRPVATTVGWSHDFGKLTEWFQANFDTRAATVSEPESYTYHALLGAVLAHYALEQRGYSRLMRGVGFHATVAHHRALADVQTETARYAADRPPVEARLERVETQCTNIQTRVPSYANRLIRTASGGEGSLPDFASYLADRTFTGNLSKVRNRCPETAYGVLLLLTGTLKLADRSVVLDREIRARAEGPEGQLSPAIQRDLPHPDIVKQAIRELSGDDQPSELDQIRTNVQKQTKAAAAARYRDEDGGFLGTIQLPTGFGKTHAGLWAGLNLATTAAAADSADDRSLVYVLPYTSIIDQTAATIRNIYDHEGHGESLLVDHYLEETRIDIDPPPSDTVTDDDGAVPGEFFLGRSWRGNTVLSTFVQLFESLAGPTSNQAPKLPALQESVVVIDEPQLLDTEWWPVVGRLADLLVDQFDATVLSMTATQPRIFEQEATNEVYNLVDHDDGPLEFLIENPRVVYEIHPSVDGVTGRPASTPADTSDDSAGRREATNGQPLDYRAAAEELVAETGAGETSLAVCSTIDSARALDGAVTAALDDQETGVISLGVCLHEWVTETGAYPSGLADDGRSEFEAFVADKLAACDGVLLAHLTAAVRPPDRLRLITFLRESDLLATTRTICTATQVVEAGVDLSFDRVYRDLAPVPSLVQSGGRCNRSLESADAGTVTVWRLGTPPRARSNRLPAEDIYARRGDRLTPTVRSLPYTAAERTVAEATMIGEVVEAFYDRLHDADPGDRSLVNAVDRAASQSLRAASLIDGRDDEVEVLVARTDDERALLSDLLTAVNAEAWGDVQSSYSDTQQLRFSVAERRVERLAASEAVDRVEIYDTSVLLVDAASVPSGLDPHIGVTAEL